MDKQKEKGKKKEEKKGMDHIDNKIMPRKAYTAKTHQCANPISKAAGKCVLAKQRARVKDPAQKTKVAKHMKIQRQVSQIPSRKC